MKTKLRDNIVLLGVFIFVIGCTLTVGLRNKGRLAVLRTNQLQCDASAQKALTELSGIELVSLKDHYSRELRKCFAELVTLDLRINTRRESLFEIGRNGDAFTLVVNCVIPTDEDSPKPECVNGQAVPISEEQADQKTEIYLSH